MRDSSLYTREPAPRVLGNPSFVTCADTFTQGKAEIKKAPFRVLFVILIYL
jgi:hypothetical protein